MASKPPRKRPRRRKASKPTPICKAILLCQNTIIEQGSGNVSLIGTFTTFGVTQIPGLIGAFVAFLQLTDGHGDYDIAIEIHDLAEDRTIAKAQLPTKLSFPDRFHRLNVIIPVPPLPIPHAGKYEVAVMANAKVIDRQEFTVTASETNHEDHASDNPE